MSFKHNNKIECEVTSLNRSAIFVVAANRITEQYCWMLFSSPVLTYILGHAQEQRYICSFDYFMLLYHFMFFVVNVQHVCVLLLHPANVKYWDRFMDMRYE